jgi:hypothetical protein
MRVTCLLLLIATRAAADPDPKITPYEKLFEPDATLTLACVVQHQVGMRYDPACTPTTCDPDGQLVCTVEETRRVGTSDLARVTCTRTKRDGRSSVRVTWYARRPQGMWAAGATLPTQQQLTRLLRERPKVAARPVVGSIKKKLDPDGEDDRIDGRWDNDRYCVDTDIGKSNPSWNRWCVSRANGLVGTFHTTAESVIAERCGEPL